MGRSTFTLPVSLRPHQSLAHSPRAAAMLALPDEDLVQRYLEGGDQNAFRLLLERHQERLFGYLIGMVRDREVANDLFQETFLRVVAAMQRERATYTHQNRWLPWVMRIARNAALDHLRARKKWQDVTPEAGTADDDGDGFWERLKDGDVIAADDLLHFTERSAFLDACIDRLPPEQKEVLLMRHEAELTFREIAELTDVSINTALGRMRYALLNLRRMMVKAGKTELTEYGG